MTKLGALAFLVFTLAMRVPAFGQGETTSAIVGSVTDQTGAAISGATVTVADAENGLKRSVKTDDSGRFGFAQLKPGTYSVKAVADGFQAQENGAVSAGLGQKQTVDFKLNVASASESVVVQVDAPLINPDNPNTSTTLNAKLLEDLPNPGGDMTYPLQFAAGALINTAGSGNDFVGGTNGYGNVQFNGLPSLSNGYIVDGLETNDPLTNLNSGLSTNLVLGLNSIAEVTVNTVSYSADQGRYGASQVNYVTKSGTNRFHGNLYELWDGSRFSAADFFTNATPENTKPRSTVNHFGGAWGGRSSTTSCFSSSIPNGFGLRFPSSLPQPCPRRRFRTMCSGSCRGVAWTRSPDRLTSRRPSSCRSTRRCSPCTAIGRGLRSRFSAVHSIAMGPLPAAIRPMETVARTARAFPTRATITSKCKRLDSTTTSTP